MYLVHDEATPPRSLWGLARAREVPCKRRHPRQTAVWEGKEDHRRPCRDPETSGSRNPLLLELTEVQLLLSDVPFSIFVSVGSVL